MIFHFIYFVLMPVLRFVLPGLLLLAGTTSWAQEAPTPAGIPNAVVLPEAVPSEPHLSRI